MKQAPKKAKEISGKPLLFIKKEAPKSF
jgi:hypothetical protein